MCDYFGMSRSAYYKQNKVEESLVLQESLVIDLVQENRCLMPRLGGKKLYYLLHDDLQKVGKIGRDKFFDILRKNKMLVERKRSYTKTTQSYHHFRKWKNLISDLELNGRNQVWASDITYIRTLNGFVYLFLITDMYSRKIVGWSLSQSLSIEGAIKALKMALRANKGRIEGLIHHSDRGIQYCSHDYVKLLQKHHVKISMTEENHCYENSLAERVNGILKDEFLLNSTFNNLPQALSACTSAIGTYNEHRPHWALKLKTPCQVHDAVQAVA
jgi:Transposase and inactivated derivatives